MKVLFPVAILFSLLGAVQNLSAQTKLKPYKKFTTNVPEPSDIVYNEDFSKFFMVSDQGGLYEADTLGKKIRASSVSGIDFESMYADDKFVYVVDERTRRIIVCDKTTLKEVRRNEVSYAGGLNAGYEGMTFNQKKNCFIVVTEKNPIWFFELNNDFLKINEVKVKFASDISSICYHNDYIFALSDEDQAVFKLDPMTYEVISKWKIPVTNPEGITFDKDGHLVIVSDYERTVFKFQLTETLK